MKVPIARPSITEAERQALLEPLETGWLVQGPKVAAFEAAMQGYTGIPHAVATSSGTAALHLALVLAGVRPGDQVIVPAFTYVATANAVSCMGAEPLFADIELHSFNIDPEAIEAAVGPRTRALIVVHQFGMPADMEAIMAVALQHGLVVIEDAACALGTLYQGRHVGGQGLLGCFSFHPRKVITTGEGGMLLGHDPGLAARARVLRNHGAAVSDSTRHTGKGALLPDFPEPGYNYRMTDLQGALGLAQISRLGSLLEARRAWARRYDEALAGWDRLLPPTPSSDAGSEHSYQSYVCLFGERARPPLEEVDALGARRDRLMSLLEDRGVSVRQGTHAVHMLGWYRKTYGLEAWQFPNAYRADRLSLSLPLFADMSEAQWAFVIQTLEEALQRA